MTATQFETTLGIEAPWYIRDVVFDMAACKVTVFIDFAADSQFSHHQFEGVYPVYDRTTRRYLHLTSFGHKCILEVQVPRVQLPDGSVRMVEPSWPALHCGATISWDALSADGLRGLCLPDLKKVAWGGGKEL
ncbi:MAG: hypothetical protein ACLP29_15595 [Dissulfurispiraceae bacterium]|jgi:transposase